LRQAVLQQAEVASAPIVPLSSLHNYPMGKATGKVCQKLPEAVADESLSDRMRAMAEYLQQKAREADEGNAHDITSVARYVA
jgi:hypothetical protein